MANEHTVLCTTELLIQIVQLMCAVCHPVVNDDVADTVDNLHAYLAQPDFKIQTVQLVRAESATQMPNSRHDSVANLTRVLGRDNQFFFAAFMGCGV